MTSKQLIEKMLRVMDDEVAKFSDTIPEVQRRIYEDLLSHLKQLELTGNRLKNVGPNIRLVNAIVRQFERFVESEDYQRNLVAFAKAFEVVSSLQNQYFTSVVSRFKPIPVLNEIKKYSIEATVNSLTETGVSDRFSGGLREILMTAITTGAKYGDMVETLRTHILNPADGQPSNLERYVKQIATDAIHQFSAQYSAAITEDLGLEWFEYVGSNIETTRPWCRHMTEKRWIHKSELNTVISDNIDGVRICSAEIPCDKKTGLPSGMKAGTNAENLKVLRGGWQCGHQLIPITTEMVPLSVRMKIAA